jgi:hypothetical protein
MKYVRSILVAMGIAATGLTAPAPEAHARARATTRAPMATPASGVSALPQSALGQRSPERSHGGFASQHHRTFPVNRVVSVLVPTRIVPSTVGVFPRATSHTTTRPVAQSIAHAVPVAPQDFAESDIPRDFWPWKRVAPPLAVPAYAGAIRRVESPARAIDGASFVADGVTYALRGIAAPGAGTPLAAAAPAQAALQQNLDSGERIMVYPVRSDGNGRMLADVVVGGADLASLLQSTVTSRR